MKKALLVGLNHYPDPANNLKGCVNDILQTSKVLQEAYGFDAGSRIRLLADERATTAAIVDRLRWLVNDAQAGDVLVFHYSGHGSQVRDREGDELDDGLDEIICPYDLDWDDPFTDDDLHDIVKGLRPGASLTIILDCCHSGTGLRRLEFGRAPMRSKCLAPPPDLVHRIRPFIEDCGPNRRLTMTEPREVLRLRQFGKLAAQTGAILLAGCQASQTSADAWIDGDYHGAFTHFLWRTAAERRYDLSYAELISGTVRALDRAGYEQVPQLEAPPAVFAQPAFMPLTTVV